jgi:DNA-binding transcriptional ArsR family regulator
MANLFKALSDPTRRAILDMLKQRDCTAGEIGEAFDMTAPSISHHLSILKTAGLVTDTREGRFIRYELNTTVLEEAMQWLLELTRPDREAKK